MEPLNYSELLDNYYEGFTSLAEEKKLMTYLKQYNGNNPELLEAKILFSAIETEKDETLDLDFDRIIATKQPSNIRKMLIYVGSLAAAAAIIFSVFFMNRVFEKPVIYAYINGEAITDKEMAMEYSKQAIMHLSEQFNKGAENLNSLNKLNKPAELLTIIKQ